MAILPRFSTPGNLADIDPDAWNSTVGTIFAGPVGNFPQFYDPTVTDTPADAQVASIIWPAFPASLQGTQRERLEIADRARGAQDEYCEWAVERNADGRITRVTFTTEVPEYFKHLFATDPNSLLALYQELVDVEADLARLQDSSGSYVAANEWNSSTTGRPVHLVQITNNLEAAVQLAAQATILRERDGVPVTHAQTLVECAALGEPLRNSDPQIAAAVNNAAAAGSEITLHDPLGLYIDGLITGGMETPDGEDPAAFWKSERGDTGHTLRASYAVPEEEGRGYVVGDITIDGRQIVFGGQLAVRVRVRLDAVVKRGDHQPQRQACLN